VLYGHQRRWAKLAYSLPDRGRSSKPKRVKTLETRDQQSALQQPGVQGGHIQKRDRAEEAGEDRSLEQTAAHVDVQCDARDADTVEMYD